MPEQFNYCHTLRVRYSEIDGQMIVFNSNYLIFFDVALTEYFRDLGITFFVDSEEPQFDYSLIQTTVRFHSPAFFDDVLQVYVRVSTIKTSSFTVNFVVKKQGSEDLVTTGETVYVGYDAKQGKKIPVPDDVRLRIERFESSGSL